jgi:hypothetical protein
VFVAEDSGVGEVDGGLGGGELLDGDDAVGEGFLLGLLLGFLGTSGAEGGEECEGEAAEEGGDGGSSWGR